MVTLSTNLECLVLLQKKMIRLLLRSNYSVNFVLYQYERYVFVIKSDIHLFKRKYIAKLLFPADPSTSVCVDQRDVDGDRLPRMQESHLSARLHGKS